MMTNISQANPAATVIQARSTVSVDQPEYIRGKRILAIEDGPTLTHGEMGYGSGVIAAQRYGAAELIDPRPFAQGTLAETFRRYPWIEKALPAMGYSPAQLRELADTIAAVPCDTVIIATPVDLPRLIQFSHPYCRVRYDLEEVSRPDLAQLLGTFLQNHIQG